MDRRTALQRVGAGAAAAWTIPQVLTQPAVAAQTAPPVAPLFVAVGIDGARAWRSTDDGVTWTAATTPPPVGNRAVATDGAGTWIAVGSGAWRSTDGGATWSAVSVPPGSAEAVGFRAGGVDDRWMAVGTFSAWWSTDGGLTWTAATTPPSVNAFGLMAISDLEWVAVGESGIDRTTDGGATWLSEAVAGAPVDVYGVASDGSTALAVGDGSWADAGSGTWPATASAPTSIVYALVAGGPGFVAAGGGPLRVFRTSDAGTTWTAATTPPDGSVEDLATDGSVLVAGGFQGSRAWRSTDGGVTWSAATTSPDGRVAGLAYG